MNAAAAPSPSPPLARGRQLATLHCGGCHAVGPAGASPNRAAPPFRELNDRHAMDAVGPAFSGGVIAHHPAMARLHFAQADVEAVLAYLKSIQIAPPARR
jgi:mono/diheme cytochrome c family protein